MSLPIERIHEAFEGEGHKAAMYVDDTYMCLVVKFGPAFFGVGVFSSVDGKWYLQGKAVSGTTLHEAELNLVSQSELLGIPTEHAKNWQHVPNHQPYLQLISQLHTRPSL